MLKNYLKSILPTFLSGILGSILTITVWNATKSEPHFATVNITHLVDQFIKTETEKHLPPDVLKREVNQFGNKLEFTLKALSKEQHLILLPTEAVISGADDYTQVVRKAINNKRDIDE